MNGLRRIDLAVLLSLLLHAMLLVFGAGGGTERTLFMALDNDKSAANRDNGDSGAISVLLLTQESPSSTITPDSSFDDTKNDGQLVTAALTGITEPFSAPKPPNGPPDPVDNTSMTPTGTVKSVHHSIPLDEYSAQIMGRIERAWVRPLAQLGDAFHCEVQIAQSPQGEVRDVTLTHCDGDAAWRESITRAIRYASPLPAPPSEKEFRPVLTFNFQADPMSPALLADLISGAEELSQAEYAGGINHPTAGGTTIGNRRADKPHTP